MRVRFVGFSAAIMLLLSMAGFIATANAAPNAATTATAATKPAVHTPTPTATKPAPTATVAPTQEPTQTPTRTPTEPAADAGTPVATESPVAVVTLVLWYEQTPDAGPLKLGPVQINENGVSGPGDAANSKLTGSVDFEDPDTGLPKITLGESTFEGYAVNPDDPDTVLRWTYFNDDPSLRPATLVVQINATAGPYKDYDGSATFVSRAAKSGGVLIITLHPASS